MKLQRRKDSWKPESRLKVAMILPECHPRPWGGTQRQAMFLASRLQAVGLSITVVSRSRGIFRTGDKMSGEDLRRTGIHEGVRLCYLPSLESLPAWSFLVAFLIKSMFRPHRFQVLHAHTAATGVIACLVGWLTGAKTVVKFPSMKNADYLKGAAWPRRIRRWILTRRVDRIVALNRDMAKALLRTGFGAHQVALIPNGIELNGAGRRRERAAVNRSLLGAVDAKVVLFVGRLITEKGLDRLLEVWRALGCRDGAVLVIAGDGPLRQELEAKAMGVGNNANIRFLGYRDDVADLYAVAELFVLPSRTEGMSNALLEAMAAGVPVVASDVDGNRDVIEHRKNGFVVDWDDTRACADLLSSLLGDAKLRSLVGQAGQERATSFAMAEIAGSYTRLYRELLGYQGDEKVI